MYIYQIKINGSCFPVQVSVFHSGCVSFKYGPRSVEALFEFSRRSWTVGICDVCLMGFTSSSNVCGKGWVTEATNKDTMEWNDEKTNKGWCRVSKDQNSWVRCKEGGGSWIKHFAPLTWSKSVEMTKSNTRHQNMSKTRRQNGKKNK